MYLLLKERQQTVNPHHIHIIMLFSLAQELFTRPHHDANDSRFLWRPWCNAIEVRTPPTLYLCCLILSAYWHWRRVNVKKKKKTTKVTIYEAVVITIILLFPLFLTLTSVETDSCFFPSVNVNCPFKLYQNFISGLKFYCIIKKVQIFKHRIRFLYREIASWATSMSGLPIHLIG